MIFLQYLFYLSHFPFFKQGKGYEEKTAMCGRLLCDVKISAKELIQAKSYELAPLVSKVLHVPETNLKTLTKKEVKDMYE